MGEKNDMHTLHILLQALGVILLADFVTGIGHWLEDAYGTEETPVIGPLVIKPNIVHQHYPRLFTKLTWWQSSWDLLLLGALIVGGAAWADVLTWHVWLFAILCINANQVHKWSHQTRAEVGPVVSFLQDYWILQTPRQHALHHTDPKNTFYCPLTNLLNPALEFVGLWPKLEAVIEALTGATHRQDASNRGAGPAPTWVAELRRPSPVATPTSPRGPGNFP